MADFGSLNVHGVGGGAIKRHRTVEQCVHCDSARRSTAAETVAAGEGAAAAARNRTDRELKGITKLLAELDDTERLLATAAMFTKFAHGFEHVSTFVSTCPTAHRAIGAEVQSISHSEWKSLHARDYAVGSGSVALPWDSDQVAAWFASVAAERRIPSESIVVKAVQTRWMGSRAKQREFHGWRVEQGSSSTVMNIESEPHDLWILTTGASWAVSTGRVATPSTGMRRRSLRRLGELLGYERYEPSSTLE